MTFHQMIFGRKPGEMRRFFDTDEALAAAKATQEAAEKAAAEKAAAEKAAAENAAAEKAAKKAAKQAAEEAAAKKAAEEAAAKQAAEEAAAKKAAEEAAAAAKKDPNNAELERERAEKAELLREVMEKKAKLKEFDGVDPAKYREMLKREVDAEKAAAEAKGDFDRVKQMMAEEHAKDLKALQDKLADLQGENSKHLTVIDRLTIGNDFTGSSYIRDELVISASKARALYGTHFEVQDGQTVAFDKPAGSANRTMMVDASGKPLGFDDAFKRIIEADSDSKSLIRAKMKPGADSKITSGVKSKQLVRDELFGAKRIAANIDKM